MLSILFILIQLILPQLLSFLNTSFMMPCGSFHPVELCVQVLTLSAIGFSTEKISKSLNLSPRTVQSIVKKGRDCSYRPEVSLRVQLEFVEDRK
jgi:hypothetical protein